MSGPALKGPIEGALLREARLEGNFAYAAGRVFKQVFGNFFLGLFDQVPEGNATLRQPSGEGPAAHSHMFPNLEDAGNATGQCILD